MVWGWFGDGLGMVWGRLGRFGPGLGLVWGSGGGENGRWNPGNNLGRVTKPLASALVGLQWDGEASLAPSA